MKVAEDFAPKFRDAREGTSWNFNFSTTKNLLSALSLVEGTALNLPYHYQFSLSDSEIKDFAGFAFQIDSQEDLYEAGKISTGKMKGKNVVSDDKTLDVFADTKGKEALSAGAKEVSWRDFPGSKGGPFYRLNVRAEMRDPLWIPHPREITESPTH